MRYIFCLMTLAALAASDRASAVGSVAQVLVIDRKTGAELVPHYYRGEYWVVGTPGTTYAIEIRNWQAGRVLAVTSVDGVNVISGATAGWDQAGYVFDPGQGYQITGWRKSDSEVAAFTFTASPGSYAERTGRPENVGVIGVALFRERQAPPVYSEGLYSGPPYVPVPAPAAPAASAAPVAPAREAAAAPAPSSSAASASRDSAGSRLNHAESAPLTAYSQPAPKLGTGHGERESSLVSNTHFERQQTRPNEVIRIRYDSLQNLVAMGVIPPPARIVADVDPFPATAQHQYVPDPP